MSILLLIAEALNKLVYGMKDDHFFMIFYHLNDG